MAEYVAECIAVYMDNNYWKSFFNFVSRFLFELNFNILCGVRKFYKYSFVKIIQINVYGREHLKRALLTVLRAFQTKQILIY